MFFTLSTSRRGYNKDSKIQMDHKTCLESLGFTFGDSGSKSCYWIKGSPTIQINTIEELMDLISVHGELVISDGSIEIYNDYRE